MSANWSYQMGLVTSCSAPGKNWLVLHLPRLLDACGHNDSHVMAFH